MTHTTHYADFPLIQRLLDECQYTLLTPDNHEALMAEHDTLVLFFAANPKQYPESLDVAVILPELINAFKGQLTPVLVSPDHHDHFQQRYPFSYWPALVFVKRGVVLGNICKVQDWADYIDQIKQLLSPSSYLDNIILTQSAAEPAANATTQSNHHPSTAGQSL